MMKISWQWIAACAAALVVTGCGNSASSGGQAQSDDAAQTSGQPSSGPGVMSNGLPASTPTPQGTGVPSGNTVGPAALSTTPTVDDTKVPATTKINGKTVKLIKMSDGLEYYDITVGTGAVAKPGGNANMLYTGSLDDGTVFDASKLHGNTPFPFTIGGGQVIPGWDEGVVGMKVGGTRRLIIPGNLAYGPNPPPGAPIPPNATLIFDVKLVSLN